MKPETVRTLEIGLLTGISGLAAWRLWSRIRSVKNVGREMHEAANDFGVKLPPIFKGKRP